MSTKRIYLLNGPNLNLLGLREPELYGADTLADIEARCQKLASSLQVKLTFRQSNYEGELVTWVQEARTEADALILNAGAYSHTSIAILDALRAFDGPKIELHLTNVLAREPFRHESFVALGATAVMAGFGAMGYELAIEGAVRLLE